MDEDRIYFRRRANEEREAALKCSDPNARRSHLELAKRYQEQADGAGQALPQEPVRSSR